jgi:hypothetical protein
MNNIQFHPSHASDLPLLDWELTAQQPLLVAWLLQALSWTAGDLKETTDAR